MSDDLSPVTKARIQATCETMQELGLTIDRSQEFDDGPISSSDSGYLDYCQNELAEGAQRQKDKRPNQEPQIWSPLMMTTATNFAKSHGFELHIIPALHESDLGNVPLSSCGHGINMGLAPTRIYASQRDFERGLRHEGGHIADNEYLRKKFPELAPLLSCVPMDPEETRPMIKKLLEIMTAALTPREAAEFQDYARQVIGPIEAIQVEDLANIAEVLFEAFRYGEEAYVQEVKDHYFWPEYRHFKKGGKSQKNNPLAEELQIARMQEGQVWEKFKKQPAFDPKSIRGINTQAVKFFRLSIKASHLFLQQ